MNQEIKEKAEYCLNCKIKPCSNKGCPLNNDIPEFIKQVKTENYEEAYDILTNTTVLQSLCGRICPHKKQCQGTCVRGIKGNSVSIGDLEAFVGDYAIKNNLRIKTEEKKELLNKKVAIIGRRSIRINVCGFFSQKRGKGYHI